MHSKTRTPINATLLVSASILFMALLLPLVTLAQITSFILLIIFMLVNASCFWISYRDQNVITANLIAAVIGMLTCVMLLSSAFIEW